MTEFNENDAPEGCVAVRSKECKGCVFNDGQLSKACWDALCMPHTREDGCNVHFVKKEEP